MPRTKKSPGRPVVSPMFRHKERIPWSVCFIRPAPSCTDHTGTGHASVQPVSTPRCPDRVDTPRPPTKDKTPLLDRHGRWTEVARIVGHRGLHANPVCHPPHARPQFTWHQPEAIEGVFEPTDTNCGPTNGTCGPIEGGWTGRFFKKIKNNRKVPPVSAQFSVQDVQRHSPAVGAHHGGTVGR